MSVKLNKILMRLLLQVVVREHCVSESDISKVVKQEIKRFKFAEKSYFFLFRADCAIRTDAGGRCEVRIRLTETAVRL